MQHLSRVPSRQLQAANRYYGYTRRHTSTAARRKEALEADWLWHGLRAWQDCHARIERTTVSSRLAHAAGIRGRPDAVAAPFAQTGLHEYFQEAVRGDQSRRPGTMGIPGTGDSRIAGPARRRQAAARRP